MNIPFFSLNSLSFLLSLFTPSPNPRKASDKVKQCR